MVLFLAQYPSSGNSKEGMLQRIASMDTFYIHQKRVYLTISFRRNFKKDYFDDGALEVVRLNFFLNFFLIINFYRKAKKIYIHSLYNVVSNFFFLMCTKKPIILDVHGVVPEEEEFKGNTVVANILNFIEDKIFAKKKLKVITVTDAMSKYYRSKYPKRTFEIVNYCIFPSHLSSSDMKSNELSMLDVVNIVYSGNLQKWQNIELMLNAIKDNIDGQKHFYILTGQLDEMSTLINERFSRDLDKITVMSLPADQLHNIYKKCHYGFILRDDIVVNRVACPTKLVEYLYHGITPIVLDENIGDFKELGYEYLKISELNSLKPRKSYKNVNVIHQLINSNNNVDIASL